MPVSFKRQSKRWALQRISSTRLSILKALLKRSVTRKKFSYRYRLNSAMSFETRYLTWSKVCTRPSLKLEKPAIAPNNGRRCKQTCKNGEGQMKRVWGRNISNCRTRKPKWRNLRLRGSAWRQKWPCSDKIRKRSETEVPWNNYDWRTNSLLPSSMNSWMSARRK